jgi:hypothetical protein
MSVQADWVVLGLVCAVLVAAVVVAVVTTVKYSNGAKALKPSAVQNGAVSALATIQTFPGNIVSTGKDDIPVVQINGSWLYAGTDAFPVVLSGVSSSLKVMTGLPVGRSLFLLGGLLTYTKLCNTFTPKDIDSKPWALTTKAAEIVPGLKQVTIGLAPGKNAATGKYTSPFLQTLIKEGYTSWTFTNRANLMALYVGTPAASCLNWCWVPLDTAYPEKYVINLKPTQNEFWTHAVIDVGRWLSVMPGGSPDRLPLLLQTGSNCPLAISSEAYVVTADSDLPTNWCILGVSAVAFQSACTFDLAGGRVGLSTVAIGNIVENSKTYLF